MLIRCNPKEPKSIRLDNLPSIVTFIGAYATKGEVKGLVIIVIIL